MSNTQNLSDMIKDLSDNNIEQARVNFHKYLQNRVQSSLSSDHQKVDTDLNKE